MSRNVAFVAVVVVLVAAAAVWFLGGGKALFGPSEPAVPGGGGDAPSEVAGPGAKGGPGGADTAPGTAGALAAGGRHPERKGVGRIAGAVVKVGTQAAAEGATVRVKGIGHGGEVVDLTARADAKGKIAFPTVPAGVGFEVRVEASGDPVVLVPDVEVRAGRATDLGTLVVGARAVLAGRVVDEKGAGVAGAVVSGYRGYENLMEMMSNLAELFGSLGREPTALARTTTDAEGRFKLEDLAPGPMSVRATSPGKKLAVAKVRMTASGPAGGAPTLVLEPGASVSGVVVDEAGAGVAQATIAMMDESSGGEDPTDMLFGRVFATTDAKGAFQAVVPEEARKLRGIVEAAGYPTTFTPEFRAGATDLKFVLLKGAEVEITVLAGSADAPVEGAQVLLGIAEKGSMGDPTSGGGIASGVTDARGVVTLPGRAGRIEVLMVSHPTLGTGMASPAGNLGGERSMGLEGDVPKEIRASGVTRMTLRMKAGVAVHGKVTDKAGAPVVGAEVRSMSFGLGGSGASVRTGDDGAYRLEGVSAPMGGGGTMLVVKAAGFVQKLDTLQIGDAERQAGEVVHDVTLAAGAVVRGQVLDPAGQPVAGAEVAVVNGGFDMNAILGGGAKAQTDADGAFVLRDVGAGTDIPGFDVTASGGEDAAKMLERMKPRVRVTAEGFVTRSSDPVALKPGGETTVPPMRLSRGATLSGVVREPSGRGADGARVEVSVSPDDGNETPGFDFRSMLHARSVRCDAEGRFTVPTLAKGSVTLTATKPEAGAASRKTLKIAGDDDAPKVEIDLRNALELKGRVVGPDGRGLADADVSTGDAIQGREGDDAWAESKSAKTDANGDFAVKGLPPGTLEVSATAEGHRRGSTAAAPGGAAIEIRLAVRGAGDAKRLQEIRDEMGKIGMAFTSAKDQSEREALQKRLMELMQEQRELQADSPSDAAAPDAATAPANR